MSSGFYATLARCSPTYFYSLFVSCCSDIEVQKTIERYEKITWAKIKRDKSSGLHLSSWIDVAGGPVCILRVWFSPDLQNWLEVQVRLRKPVHTEFRRHFSLKRRTELGSVYTFSLILYRVSVFPLSRDRLKALEHLLFSLLGLRNCLHCGLYPASVSRERW